MQVDHGERHCPACGAAGLRFSAVLHHMVCAWVGPDYDFMPQPGGYRCPKCRRCISNEDPTCEILGTSARCAQCHREIVVSPAKP